MAHDIFISYRREDTRADAGRLYDRLSARFGDDHVFMDIEDIEPGQNFVQVLDRTLETCSVMIVLIGKGWLGEGKAEGDTRLGDLRDFVRIEVEKALERGIQVFPVLVGSAEMPSEAVLPASLLGLSRRQAFELSDARFHEDVDHLIGLFEERGAGRLSRAARTAAALAAAALVLSLAVGVIVMRGGGGAITLRSEPREIDGNAAVAMLAARDFFDARRYAAGKGMARRFELGTAGGDLVVTDGGTGLMWQRAGSGTTLSGSRAGDYVARLNADRFAGHADWRLPTLEEAMSLMEPEKQSGWHLDPVFAPGAAAFVWTSDTTPTGDIWVVYYFDGTSASERSGFHAFVRAVRTSRPSSATRSLERDVCGAIAVPLLRGGSGCVG